MKVTAWLLTSSDKTCFDKRNCTDGYLQLKKNARRKRAANGGRIVDAMRADPTPP